MKIAVTGATGMLGKACIEYFSKSGHEVLALARRKFTNPVHQENVTSHVTDYSKSDLRYALQGVDSVVHLAAMRPNPQADSQGYRSYFEANVKTTENLLFAAGESGCGSISLASSISVYSAWNRVPYREADYPYPLNLYGASKLACEHLLYLYSKRWSTRWTSLRIAQIIGLETSRDKMVMRFLDLARRKEPLPLWGKGVGARDAVYVKDVVAAIECTLDNQGISGVYNIGGGRAFSHHEVAETINATFDNVGNITFLSSQPEDTSFYFMECQRAQSELGWQRRWNLSSAFKDLRLTYGW